MNPYKPDLGTFQGFRIIAKVEKAEEGSERYRSLTEAAAQWRAFAASSLGSAIDENVARELEIQRDHGLCVAINPRC